MTTAERPHVEVQRSPGTCPYCHDGVSREDDIVVCRDCNARHHEACWRESAGACATCSSTSGLGAVVSVVAAPPSPRDERERDAAIAARVRIGTLIAELEKQRDDNFMRKPWVFLLPHLYIPLFWPFLLIGLHTMKAKARTGVARIKDLARENDIELTKSERTLLDEEETWAARWY